MTEEWFFFDWQRNAQLASLYQLGQGRWVALCSPWMAGSDANKKGSSMRMGTEKWKRRHTQGYSIIGNLRAKPISACQTVGHQRHKDAPSHPDLLGQLFNQSYERALFGPISTAWWGQRWVVKYRTVDFMHQTKSAVVDNSALFNLDLLDECLKTGFVEDFIFYQTAGFFAVFKA